MKITELMTRQVVEIDEDSAILEAAKKMSDEKIGSLIVVRKGEQIGIITEKDVVSFVAREGDLKGTAVKSIMSSPLITVDKDTDGKDAVNIMMKNNVNRLPIVDNGKIVGIFSTADFIKLERAQAKEIVENAIKEYNKYRSPEVTAGLISIDNESFTIRFEGTFCEQCGKDNDYHLIEYFLGEKGIEANITKKTELEDEAIATYKIIKETFQTSI